jgi:GH43 family beta-xylosidase
MMKWKNPVYDGCFADPFVWKHNGKYYAVGTGPISEQSTASEAEFSTRKINSKVMAIPLLTSDDMVNWKLHGGAYEVPDFAQGAVFWAPEVAYENGKFYLYFSYATEGLNHKLRVAVSENPEGPYQDAGALMANPGECPFAIDASPFRDDDGEWYLFYARDFLDHSNQARAGTALEADRLVDMTRLAGEPKTVLRARNDWQLFKAQRTMYGKVYDWHTLEGPCVIKKGEKYFCTYSGGCYEGEGYGVDYGTADSVMGPYADTGNEKGARILRTVPGKVLGPGHHSIVKGPDDKTDFMVYHAWDPGMTARRMHIDLLQWTDAGPRCKGPTWMEQNLPL